MKRKYKVVTFKISSSESPDLFVVHKLQKQKWQSKTVIQMNDGSQLITVILSEVPVAEPVKVPVAEPVKVPVIDIKYSQSAGSHTLIWDPAKDENIRKFLNYCGIRYKTARQGDAREGIYATISNRGFEKLKIHCLVKHDDYQYVLKHRDYQL